MDDWDGSGIPVALGAWNIYGSYIEDFNEESLKYTNWSINQPVGLGGYLILQRDLNSKWAEGHRSQYIATVCAQIPGHFETTA